MVPLGFYSLDFGWREQQLKMKIPLLLQLQPLGERDETQKLPPATTELLLFLVVSSSEQGFERPLQ